MAANAGYLYFLENWIRHADKQGVDVRNNTLILTDENTAKVVKGLGFRPVSTKLYRADILFESSQDQQTASPIFAAAPSHSGTNAMALAALTDLLQLGVNVLWTDADTVVNKDPLPWLSSAQPYATCADFEIEQRDGDLRERVSQHWPRVLCFNESASALMNATGAAWRSPDVQMMDDSRWDSAGPGNTGFAYFRSRCRTLDFSRAILASLQVLLASSSDQRFLMRMLHGPEFSQNISFALLPISRFINGPNLLGHKNAPWQRQPGMLDANDQGFPPPRWIAGHASWTASHKDKPPMLRKLGAWHMHDLGDGDWDRIIK